MTTQARFSLIQDTTVIEVDDEDYTSLKTNRESYDPYCSLSRDNADMVWIVCDKRGNTLRVVGAEYAEKWLKIVLNECILLVSKEDKYRNDFWSI